MPYPPALPSERPPERPSNYLVWGILSTIFCCLPFGIVSIVYAAKIDRLWAEKDYAAAYNAASNAKMWFWLSFGLGLFIQIIYFTLYFLGIVASAL